MRGRRLGDGELKVWFLLAWLHGAGGEGVRGRDDELVPLVPGRGWAVFGGDGAGGGHDCGGLGDGGFGDVLEDVDGEGVEELVGEDEGGACFFCGASVCAIIVF